MFESVREVNIDVGNIWSE